MSKNKIVATILALIFSVSAFAQTSKKKPDPKSSSPMDTIINFVYANSLKIGVGVAVVAGSYFLLRNKALPAAIAVNPDVVRQARDKFLDNLPKGQPSVSVEKAAKVVVDKAACLAPVAAVAPVMLNAAIRRAPIESNSARLERLARELLEQEQGTRAAFALQTRIADVIMIDMAQVEGEIEEAFKQAFFWELLRQGSWLFEALSGEQFAIALQILVELSAVNNDLATQRLLGLATVLDSEVFDAVSIRSRIGKIKLLVAARQKMGIVNEDELSDAIRTAFARILSLQ